MTTVKSNTSSKKFNLLLASLIFLAVIGIMIPNNVEAAEIETCDYLKPPEHFDDKQAWRFMNWQYEAVDTFGLSCEQAKIGTKHMMIENGYFDPKRTNIGPINISCAIGIPQNHVQARWGLPCWIVQRIANPDRFTKEQVQEAKDRQCGAVKCGKLTDYYWQRWDYWNKFNQLVEDGWSTEHIIGSHLYGKGGVWEWTASQLRNGEDWHYNTNGRKIYGYYKKVANKII